MNLEQFASVVETHGSKPSNWPENLRSACLKLVDANDSAQHLLEQHRQLEALLDEISPPSFAGLEARILQQALPPQPQSVLDSLLDWLIPDSLGVQLWRPITAACLPLVFGIAIGNFFSFGIENSGTVLESWDDELTLLSFNDLSSIAAEPEL